MIHIIVGTKAQLIKMAPIMVELQNRNVGYNFILTGQHQDVMDELREDFGIKEPDYIMSKGKDVTSIFQMIFWINGNLIKTIFNKKKIFKRDKMGIVLVHGDTFSTLLGALMGKLSGNRVGHVESGLRSFNYFNPFPEEITRILTFQLSDYYFCPGEWALNNLKSYKGVKINTGINTLYDSLQLAKKRIKCVNVDIPNYKYAIVTLHRFENIFKKDQLEKIVGLLEEISGKNKLLFILHKPTEQQLKRFNLYTKLEKNKNIELRPRYDYLKFIKLMMNSEFVISDGGSNQEEGFYLGVPCLLFRYKTERQEGLNENVLLSKFSRDKIDYFVKNYKEFKKKKIKREFSPSKLIVREIANEENR